MSAAHRRAFRFANAQQWSACLFEGANRSTEAARGAMRPYVPYGHAPSRYATSGAAAPAITGAGELLWRDDRGHLYRLAPGDRVPVSAPAPDGLARAPRIVAGARLLWGPSTGRPALECFDAESCTRGLSVDLAGMRILDIASDRRDGVMALCARGESHAIVHVDCAGQWREWGTLARVRDASGLAYFRGQDRAVVLAAHGKRLYWFDGGEQTPRYERPVGSIRPCYTASAIAGGGRAKLVLVGMDDAVYGGAARLLVLDGEGNRLEDFALDAPATGVAATRHAIAVTDGAALAKFESACIATDSDESRCVAVTPALYSPEDDAARRWSRIEATAILPPGTALELSYAASDDANVVKAALAVTQDDALPVSERLQRLRSVTGPWTVAAIYTGSEARAASPGSTVPIAAPLHDIRERYLWVSASLAAAPGARLPELTGLEVLYGAPTLMDQLPALYRRAAQQPGDALRALVGVLEATTQDIDSRIASMAQLIHPHTAPVRWLDFLAEWIGLPWDEALAGEQKRCIAAHAAEIVATRGTRQGLETLLGCLWPGATPRFRVIDVSADYGAATLGGARCCGSRLPAVLPGLPMSAARLGERAVFGHMRLTCPGPPPDPYSRFAGRVLVDVMATADERRAWEPWLSPLLTEMLPVTARLRLRWVSPAASWYRDRLDDERVLEPDPEAYLGTSAVTGLARLGADAPVVLSPMGAGTGARLG